MSEQPGMREFLGFLRRICGLLIECGCSSNRVELLTQLLGEAWGYEVETLAIPTGVWLSVRRGDHFLIDLTRVRSWSVDLDRLARLSELVELVRQRHLTIAEATARLKHEATTKPPYGVGLTLLAGGCASPVLVYAYGGAPLEIALGLPAGVLVQALSQYVFTNEQRRYVGDFLTGAAVAGFAYGCRALVPWVDAPRLIIGGIVVILPGLVLVNAVHEVAQKNLVSGAAKLLEALMVTSSLGFGVAFVLALLRVLGVAIVDGGAP